MKLLRFFSLVHIMSVMKLKSQSNKLVLSYLWWVLEPAFFVAMFYIVFKHVLHRGTEDFLTFLMVGKIPFLWFQKSVISASQSLIQNKGLIMTKVMPKITFPMVNVQESSYKQLFVFLTLFAYLILFDSLTGVQWFDFVFLFALQYLIMLGIGALCSILVAYIPDFSMLIQMLMMGLMFGSGVFWDIHSLPNEAMRNLILTFNPLATLLDGYRQVLMYKSPIEFSDYSVTILIATFSLSIALLILKQRSGWLTERLMA